MPRPTKEQQRQQDDEMDKLAPLIALMEYLRVLRVQTEGRADLDVTLMTIGQAESVGREIKRVIAQ